MGSRTEPLPALGLPAWEPQPNVRRRGTGRRMGLGFALSAACHLLALAGLAAFVTRAGSTLPGGGIANVDVDPHEIIRISSADESALAEALAQGPPALGAGASTTGGEPSAVGAAASVTGAASASGAAASAIDSIQVAGVDPAPAQVRPAGEGATRPGPARRAVRRASRAGSPTAAASAPPAAAPEKAVPAPPPESAPSTGTPVPSPRSLFLAQLKRHLRAAWRAGEVYARVDPTGRLEGSMFVSGLQVRLRANGTVERAELKDSSGIPDLDHEAQGTVARMQPMPPLPDELVDASGGFDVRCSFHLDVGLFRFANKLHHAIAEHWRPSQAFAATSEVERKTVVRLRLDRQGVLVDGVVVASAGVDFLDSGAVAWVKPGIRFPPPPPAFGKGEGPVPVFVAFLHRAGEPRVLKPREDLEAE